MTDLIHNHTFLGKSLESVGSKAVEIEMPKYYANCPACRAAQLKDLNQGGEDETDDVQSNISEMGIR